MEGQNFQSPQCLNTCSEQNGYVLTLSNAQPVLQYGNPYASQETRGYYSIFGLGLAASGVFLWFIFSWISKLLV